MIAIILGLIVLTLVFIGIGYAQDDKTYVMAGVSMLLLFIAGLSLLFFGTAWFTDAARALI